MKFGWVREQETVFPDAAKRAVVDRLSRAAFAERVTVEELLTIAKAHGASGPGLTKLLIRGQLYCLKERQRLRPAPERRQRLRWVPALQAWAKPGRVL